MYVLINLYIIFIQSGKQTEAPAALIDVGVARGMAAEITSSTIHLKLGHRNIKIVIITEKVL